MLSKVLRIFRVGKVALTFRLLLQGTVNEGQNEALRLFATYER